MSLWKVPASGAGEPEQLPFSVGEASCPAISRTGNRLAYQQDGGRPQHMASFAVGPGTGQRPPSPFHCTPRARTWLHNTLPTASGSPLNPTAVESRAFGSAMRTAPTLEELFSQAGASCGTARWSPDGQRIAFDFNPEGNVDIYVIRASGGKPIRLTTDPADDVAPSWSRDGKWVYFTIEPDRSIRDLEGTGRRRRGCSGDPEWRRDGLRVTRRQVRLLHERRLFSGSLEDAGEWRRGEPGAPVCAPARFLLSSTMESISFRSRAPIGSLLSSF